MPALITVTDEQRNAIEEWFTNNGGSFNAATAATLIKQYNLPWDAADNFRQWAKRHCEAYGGTNSGGNGSGKNILTLRNINKFAGKTEAMSAAEMFLGDRSKVLIGIITSLENEIGDIKLEAEQQILAIKSAAAEQITEREEKIRLLKMELPCR